MKKSITFKHLLLSLLFLGFSNILTAQYCCCPTCPGNPCVSTTIIGCGFACFICQGNSNEVIYIESTTVNCVGTICETELPVELFSFTGKVNKEETGVILKWSTASELNNQGFEIQRMDKDLMEWEILGFVAGMGTTDIENHYEFTDEKANPGRNYYRLKQIDFDGTFEFLKIVVVDFKKPDDMVRIFPTRVSSDLYFDFFETPKENPIIRIFDFLGKMVWEERIPNKIIHLDELPEGQYIIVVSYNYKEWTGRFVKLGG